MKKLLFLLSVLLNALVQGQNDLVYLRGIKDPVKCSIIDVTRFTVTYQKQDSKVYSIFETSDIEKIQLEKSTDTSFFTTEDLFKALADIDTDIFSWYGLDFSFVRICDPKNADKYSNISFTRMNSFILLPEDVKMGFKPPNKKRYLLGYGYPHLTQVNQVNKEISLDQVISCDTIPLLPLDQIRKAVQGFRSYDGKKKIGAVVFYRLIDKYNESCSVYITFFDVLSGNVLFILHQKIRGAGMKQEWHWTSKLLPVMNKLRNPYGAYFSDMMNIYGIE